MSDLTALSRKSGISIPVLWKITFQRATKHSNSIFFSIDIFEKRAYYVSANIIAICTINSPWKLGIQT